ncbi:hypothetical protein LT493_31380 [Streptomyces tricolor]|nr:hypothetical protein [Streptomyces tricolor]
MAAVSLTDLLTPDWLHVSPVMVAVPVLASVLLPLWATAAPRVRRAGRDRPAPGGRGAVRASGLGRRAVQPVRGRSDVDGGLFPARAPGAAVAAGPLRRGRRPSAR